MGEKVRVVEVTARDGLQNESKPVPTRDQLALIEKLVQAGLRDIQATSFVHPKWVPQLADAEEVKETTGLLRSELKIEPADLILHFHDTYGRGLANTLAGLESGVREFDASTVGLGDPGRFGRDAGNRRRAVRALACGLSGAGTNEARRREKLLVEAGVPAGRVLSVPEILGHPHLSGRQFVSELQGAAGKQAVTPGGFTFSDIHAAPAGPAPALSEHTEKWLEKLGYGPEKIRNLRDGHVI